MAACGTEVGGEHVSGRVWGAFHTGPFHTDFEFNSVSVERRLRVLLGKLCSTLGRSRQTGLFSHPAKPYPAKRGLHEKLYVGGTVEIMEIFYMILFVELPCILLFLQVTVYAECL